MDYSMLAKQVEALGQSEGHYLPLLSNAAAILWDAMDNINWCGFYLLQGQDEKKSLLLGPFQGKVACIRIPVGKGVCGTAVERNKTQRVADVHEFPGHIACDSASASEIVVPVRDGEGNVVGVLDIDSPVKNRFSQEDQDGLELFVQFMERTLDFDGIRNF